MDVGIVPSALDAPGRIRDAVEAAGATCVDISLDGDTEAIADLLPATSDQAVRELATANVGVPILPIGTSRGFDPVPKNSLGDAIETIIAGDATPVQHPVVSVYVSEQPPVTAIREVTLMTEEPATISEFAIQSRNREIAEYRADGVVVATPGGSPGYAHDAGGPILLPGSDALVAITVAPYRIDPDHWVLPSAPVTLTVTRDESAVVGFIDGNELGSIDTDVPVRVVPENTFETMLVPQSSNQVSPVTD